MSDLDTASDLTRPEPAGLKDDWHTRKHAVLKDVFGFSAFREGQEAVVDALLSGQNALTVMPTGSGKSLCFQVPALVLGGLTIVVSPLVALMHDQVAALHLAGVAADTINSSYDRSDNVAAWRRAAAGETRLLYLSPERLMTERMLSALGRLPLSLIAIDEAHCISQWGPAFRPEYEDLTQLKTLFPDVPIAALTATADEATRNDIAAKLFAKPARVFVAAFDRPNIHLSVEMRHEWKSQLMAVMKSHEGESGIVYCLSRRKTEATAAFLSKQGITALPYHAGMDKTERAANQDRFITESGVVIVATIAFGMGIDKPDVRFVFHTDIPGNIEAYYQEIGRAGRDGLPAEAFMLYGLDDIRMRRQFIEQEDSDSERKRREHKRLDALVGYCEAPACRRRTLLAYFGDRIEPCGACDVCQNPVELADGTAEAALVLSAIVETGERFGSAHIIDVLRGAETEKIIRMGHDARAAYGRGTAHSKDVWRSIIRQLVAADLLRLDIEGYGGLNLTDDGHAVLRGEKTFRYRVDTVRAKSASQKATKWSSDLSDALSDDEVSLLANLKKLRQELARERGVPAYVIFSDRSLEDMARRQPGSPREFADIHGVGEVKLRELAEPFLGVIAGS